MNEYGEHGWSSHRVFSGFRVQKCFPQLSHCFLTKPFRLKRSTR